MTANYTPDSHKIGVIFDTGDKWQINAVINGIYAIDEPCEPDDDYPDGRRTHVMVSTGSLPPHSRCMFMGAFPDLRRVDVSTIDGSGVFHDVTPAAPERDVPQEIPSWCYAAAREWVYGDEGETESDFSNHVVNSLTLTIARHAPKADVAEMSFGEKICQRLEKFVDKIESGGREMIDKAKSTPPAKPDATKQPRYAIHKNDAECRPSSLSDYTTFVRQDSQGGYWVDQRHPKCTWSAEHGDSLFGYGTWVETNADGNELKVTTPTHEEWAEIAAKNPVPKEVLEEHEECPFDEKPIPSREWISKMADGEDKCESVSVRSPDSLPHPIPGEGAKVERYYLENNHTGTIPCSSMRKHPSGAYVTAADHDAAIAQEHHQRDVYQAECGRLTKLLAERETEIAKLREALDGYMKGAKVEADLGDEARAEVVVFRQRAERAEAELAEAKELNSQLAYDYEQACVTCKELNETIERMHKRGSKMDPESFMETALQDSEASYAKAAKELKSLRTQLAAAEKERDGLRKTAVLYAKRSAEIGDVNTHEEVKRELLTGIREPTQLEKRLTDFESANTKLAAECEGLRELLKRCRSILPDVPYPTSILHMDIDTALWAAGGCV